jgi:hypothetical protein
MNSPSRYINIQNHDFDYVSVWMSDLVSDIKGMFEKKVLKKIFGPKTDEVTGDWRKLHNEELHKL